MFREGEIEIAIMIAGGFILVGLAAVGTALWFALKHFDII